MILLKRRFASYFDIAAIKEAGYPVVTPIVVTNTNDYLDVLDMNQTDVLHGEDF